MDSRVESAIDVWAPTVAPEETSDPLWDVLGYRVARCLLDHVQADAMVLNANTDPKIVSQLTRAVASIGANVAEGYSRRSSADRSRFYGYALGSTREAMIWYRSVASRLDQDAVMLRMAFLTQLRRLLIGMLKSVQRRDAPAFDPGP
jgi:four helix bundle protein